MLSSVHLEVEAAKLYKTYELTYRMTYPMSRTIKIFLASSIELKDDREKFEQYIYRKDKILNKHELFIHLEKWEDFIDAMSKTRLQDEYNKAVQGCDIFVMLFATKVGSNTREEFETAQTQFQKTGKPLIYVYHKIAPVDLNNVSEEDFLSLKDFQKRLNELGHFETRYNNTVDMTSHFNGQLEKLDEQFTIKESPSVDDIIRKYWQQLVKDPDFNSLRVIGKGRQRLENLYVRLQVTAHGDKTGVDERVHKLKAEKPCPEEKIWQDMPPNVAINEFQRFVVLGAPGMGKTTMFRFIAYTVSRLGLGLARTDEFPLDKKSNLVPLYLPLTELTGNGDNMLGCLKNYVHKRFPGCQAIMPVLEFLLENGQCLVLLDSLDEVTSGNVSQVKKSIMGFLSNSDWDGNVVLLSCREGSWQKNDPSLVFPTVLQIKDLDGPAIGEYLHHWFGAEASEDALALKEKICGTPRLKALATNPFLLSLIAWLSQSDKLPERRVELYKKCTDAMLREEHKAKEDRFSTNFGPDHAELKARVLTDIAITMMKENLREIKRNDLRNIIRKSLDLDDLMDERPGQLIDEIHKGSAILRETNEEHIYMFQHNTFREYYAASTLAGELVPLMDKPNLADLLDKHPDNPLRWINDPLWNEVYRLIVGLLDNPTPVLELLFDADATLAARCYLDANPDTVDHGVIRQRWANIDREQRIDIIKNLHGRLQEAQDEQKETRDVLDFMTFVFRVPETDSEVLYHCGQLLHTIDSEEAEQLNLRKFDNWPAERQYTTHEKAFADDHCWQFADIEGGEFTMGGSEDDDKKLKYEVKLSPFQLGCFTVTVGQYHRFDPDHKKRNMEDEEFFKDEKQPVIDVTWFDAYIFCQWARCRLPTEAEWEYACRAGTTTPFYTGDNLTTDQANYNGNYPYKDNPKGNYLQKTTPVGSYPPNDWGLYDMHGNVWEWCSDWYDGDYYGSSPSVDPAGPSTGSYRVLRGGGWDYFAGGCRSANRFWDGPTGSGNYLGFRAVRRP